MEQNIELLALHSEKALKYPSILQECCFILNREWPRSRALRLRTLESSRPELPANFALVQKFNDNFHVLGHARVTRIPSNDAAVWIESVVIHQNLRGGGIGRYLMLALEKVCKEKWNSLPT